MPNPQIMIVEDDRVTAQQLKQALEALGYTVAVSVETGEAALEKASRLSLDLVMMDIQLKGRLDGIQTAEQIRLQNGLPVVYLTSFTDEETIQRTKKTQPFGYLIKPFKERDLRIVLEMALEKHRLETQLRFNEMWFSTTLRCIADAVVTTDTQGRITFMNPTAASLTGCQPAEALGRDLGEVFRLLHEKTRRPLGNPALQAIKEGLVFGLGNQTVLVRQDGQEIIVYDKTAPIINPQGQTIGVVLVFQDITERKQAEERLRSQEYWLSTLINAIPDFVSMKDGQGRWLITNEYSLDLFELSGVEYQGKKDSELAQYARFYRIALELCEQTDEQAWQAARISRGEEVIPRPDGSAITFDVTKVPLFNLDGSRKGLVVVGRDITQRKQAEEAQAEGEARYRALYEELQTTQAQLIEAERLKAIGQVAAGVGHNFTHFLGLMQGGMEIIRSNLNHPEAIAKELERMERTLQRSMQTLQRIKQLAYEPQPEAQGVNYQKAVTEGLHLTTHLWNIDRSDKYRLSVDVPPDLFVVGAESELQEVLINLLRNAFEAMPKGGHLSLYARREESWGVLTIEDTGIGMTEAVKAKIFAPFFTTKGEQGTGLGLSTSYALLQQYGGKLEVESQPGHGTRFQIYLPLMPEAGAEAVPAERKEP